MPVIKDSIVLNSFIKNIPVKSTVLSDGGGATPWYQAGGASAPVAAYLAKGAASLAASYLNLVNPGLHDASVGVAPTLDSYGWVSGSGTTYLITDIIPTLNYTMIARTIGTAATQAFMGVQTSATQRFLFRNTVNSVEYYRGSAGAAVTDPSIETDTVYAVAGVNTYRNGVAEAVSGGGGTDPTHAIMLMGYNLAGGVASRMLTGTKMAGCAIYSSTLTAPQVLAVSTALAAL